MLHGASKCQALLKVAVYQAIHKATGVTQALHKHGEMQALGNARSNDTQGDEVQTIHEAAKR